MRVRILLGSQRRPRHCNHGALPSLHRGMPPCQEHPRQQTEAQATLTYVGWPTGRGSPKAVALEESIRRALPERSLPPEAPEVLCSH